MRIRQNSLAANILGYLSAAEEVSAVITASPHQWVRWSIHGKHPAANYRTVVHRLIHSGLIEIVREDKKKVLQLTPEGKVNILVLKSKLSKPEKWDRKWRIIFFDIPEDNKIERQQLRRLLVKNEFKKMQASVYVSPWPINREALVYLKDTGLIKFIRFGRLEELDNDEDLRKAFKLML